MKRNAPKPTPPSDAKEQELTENVLKTRLALLQLVHQLQMQALDADSKSRPAFEALTDTLRELFAWLHTMAALHPMSLGALQRRLPEDDAWAKYEAGEHVAAWAGVELARLYRHVQADLRSRSKHAVNRLRDIRHGFKLGKFVVPPNTWFCAEYERKADYRPTGKMAVWTAQKIEELRRIKRIRAQRRTFASIEIVEGRLRFLTENETDDVLAHELRSDLVVGEALKRLDNLPVFGSPNTEDFQNWRKFVRRRLLTQKVISEFHRLFPDSVRKLDGVVAATLRYAWNAVLSGGNLILPSCKFGTTYHHVGKKPNDFETLDLFAAHRSD